MRAWSRCTDGVNGVLETFTGVMRHVCGKVHLDKFNATTVEQVDTSKVTGIGSKRREATTQHLAPIANKVQRAHVQQVVNAALASPAAVPGAAATPPTATAIGGMPAAPAAVPDVGAAIAAAAQL